MSTLIQRSFLLLVSLAYIYIEYFFRERLLSASSDYGYSFNVNDLESLGRYIASFGLSWLVFLVLRSFITGRWWQKVATHLGIFSLVFVGFFHLQTAGVDWYVDNMSLSERKAAVGAQTFKAFTYYQEKAGDKGYNLDGDITFVDKLLLSFLPWVAYDNTNIREVMGEKLVLAAQYSVRADVEHHKYRYLNVQQRVEDSLWRLSVNYLGSLDKAPYGVNHVLSEPNFGKQVDELHWNLNTMATNAFRVYRRDLMKVYNAQVPRLYRLYSNINGDYYTRTYPTARHTRVTASGMRYGDWLRSPPSRTMMQMMTQKSSPFVHPVSKVESLLVHNDFAPLVETADDMAARLRRFNYVAQRTLSHFSGDNRVLPDLLARYRAEVSQVKGCERYESAEALRRDYAHNWTGKGHYFVQNHHKWNSKHYRLRPYDKSVEVSVHSAADWSRRPLRYEDSSFYASPVAGEQGKGSMTICDPLRYASVFARYVHPLMMSLNKRHYGVSTDMVTFAQFTQSSYWRKQMPQKVKHYGFVVDSNFNWRSKRAIGAALTRHASDKHQRLFEETLLSKLAEFSSHYDKQGVRELYDDLAVSLPLWRYTNASAKANVRKVMVLLSTQPVVRHVLKKEYPFVYDSDGQLMVLFSGRGEGKYRPHGVLKRDYPLRVAEVLSVEIEQKLNTPNGDFYAQQTRAFVVVPLAMLLSTLFILLNVVNLVFMILQWTPLSSAWLQGLRFVVVFSVLALPMTSDNEYTTSGFYENYLHYGSSTWTIKLTIWLQGSAPVFDFVHETLGKKLYKHGEAVLDNLSDTLSK